MLLAQHTQKVIFVFYIPNQNNHWPSDSDEDGYVGTELLVSHPPFHPG